MLPVFQLHGETVSLGNNLQLLGTGISCPNQIIKYKNNAYGVQGHFELTRNMLEEWIRLDEDLQTISSKDLLTDYYKLRGRYKSNARIIFTNFLKIAKLL